MRSLCFVLFLSVSAVLADEPAQRPEKPWPQKGDTVFVSATIQSIDRTGKLIGIDPESTPIPPCVPLVLKRLFEKRLIWHVDDPAGGGARLDGPWTSRFHRTASECEEALAKNGQPKVVINGYVQKIVTPSE